MSESNKEGNKTEGKGKQKVTLWERMEPEVFFKFHVFVCDTDKMLGDVTMNIIAARNPDDCVRIDIRWNNSHVRVILKVDAQEYAFELALDAYDVGIKTILATMELVEKYEQGE